MVTVSPRETQRRNRQRAELLYPAPNKDYTKPLAVRVKVARQMLGDMGHKLFWRKAAEGEFEVIGHDKLRLVTVKSLEDYIARQPRAPYSRKAEMKETA
jgi:hypothetical protein